MSEDRDAGWNVPGAELKEVEDAPIESKPIDEATKKDLGREATLDNSMLGRSEANNNPDKWMENTPGVVLKGKGEDNTKDTGETSELPKGSEFNYRKKAIQNMNTDKLG